MANTEYKLNTDTAAIAGAIANPATLNAEDQKAVADAIGTAVPNRAMLISFVIGVVVFIAWWIFFKRKG